MQAELKRQDKQPTHDKRQDKEATKRPNQQNKQTRQAASNNRTTIGQQQRRQTITKTQRPAVNLPEAHEESTCDTQRTSRKRTSAPRQHTHKKERRNTKETQTLPQGAALGDPTTTARERPGGPYRRMPTKGSRRRQQGSAQEKLPRRPLVPTTSAPCQLEGKERLRKMGATKPRHGRPTNSTRAEPAPGEKTGDTPFGRLMLRRPRNGRGQPGEARREKWNRENNKQNGAAADGLAARILPTHHLLAKTIRSQAPPGHDQSRKTHR